MEYLNPTRRHLVYRISPLNLDIPTGRISDPLNDLLQLKKVETWAFISAVIPPSTENSRSSNLKRHRKLWFSLSEFPCYGGEFNPLDDGWPPEKGILALGISQEQALGIAREFSQSSIGWGRINEPAESIKIEYSTFSIQRDQAQISSFMRQLYSGKSFDELDEDTRRWWMNRY